MFSALTPNSAKENMKMLPANWQRIPRLGLAAAAIATLLRIMSGSAVGQVSAQNETPSTSALTIQDYHNRWGIYHTYQADDDTGFVSIFDGKTLEGLYGDLTFWRAENGEIIGESTPQKVVKVNNFLI